MSKLHTIVEEVNKIPLNLGNPATKMNRIHSQAEEWMKDNYGLIKRCGIVCSYVPPDSVADDDDAATKAKESEEETKGKITIDELSEAVDEADSDLSMDLEVVVQMRELLEKAQEWIDQVNAIVAPSSKPDSRKKGGGVEKHSMEEISNLIESSSTLIVDVAEELERLKLEQSAAMSWRLKAQQTLKEIMAAFDNFRKERADVCSGVDSNDSAPEAATNPPAETTTAAPSTDVDLPIPVAANNIATDSMTTRNINSRRRALSNAGTSGGETPAIVENNGGEHLFPLITAFIKSVKSLNILTPEGSLADELNEVMNWFTKTFKLMNTTSSSDNVYDRKNFSKLDKSIESGQRLINFDGVMAEEIPEDTSLVDALRKSYAAAVKDDIDRLLELQSKRDKYIKWCEKADGLISSKEKKVSMETLIELDEQSADFPSCEYRHLVIVFLDFVMF